MNNLQWMNPGIPSEGDEPKPLSPQQMKDWNSYVDFVKMKGHYGSKELDKKSTGLAKNLLNEFIQTNPGTSINYETVKSVQQEMQKLKQSAQAFAARRNDPNATKIMGGISDVDGWPGSKTTQFKFPQMEEKLYHNDSLKRTTDLGLVNGWLNPSTSSSNVRPLPKGAKLEKMSDGRLYYMGDDGDMKLYK